MKKFTFIIIAMFLVGSIFAQQFQVPSLAFTKKAVRSNTLQTRAAGENNDFESWHTDYTAYGLGEMPTGFDMLTGNPAGQKSADAQAGSYAVRVENGVVTNAVLGWTDTLVGGYAFSSQGMLFGAEMFQPYTQRPTTMTFWAKGEIMGVNDSALIIFQTTKLGELVGGAMAQFGASDLTTTFQEFTLTFDYALTELPDSAVLIITSTGVGVFQEDIGTLTDGSYMIVDNISYEYEVLVDPVAACSPLSWNAGNVDLSTTSTSGTFTLTNIGGGSLTVSGATALSAPWSTSFVSGDVTLLADETYTFDFSFNPTVEGAVNQEFVITTNGGDITIDLSGTGFAGCDAITAFPYTNGFEDADFGCWEVKYNTETDGGINGANLITPPTTNTWFLCTAASFGGAGAEYIYDGAQSAALGYTAPDFNWLISPEIELPAANKELNFMIWYFQDADFSTNFYVNVYNGSTWTPALTYTTGQATNEFAELVTVNLSAYASSTIKVAFVYEYTDGYQLAIDNVEIDDVVSVNSNITSAISVFPNPASSVVTVANAENANIVVINMVGEVVANVENASANQTIDMSNLANGTYFVRVNAEVFKINLVK